MVEFTRPERSAHANGTGSLYWGFEGMPSSSYKSHEIRPKSIFHDLLFLGSQFSASIVELNEIFILTKEGANERSICPYHSQLNKEYGTLNTVHKDQDILERYIAEDPEKQYAIFYQPDSSRLSISKNCSCHLLHHFQL